MLNAKVFLPELLYELGVVKCCSSCGWLGLFYGDVLGASTADIQAWLFGFARWLVNDASLQDAERLHGSHASEDLQHLIMATCRDLPVQQQLVHRVVKVEKGGIVSRTRRSQYRYAISGGQGMELGRGVDKNRQEFAGGGGGDWR